MKHTRYSFTILENILNSSYKFNNKQCLPERVKQEFRDLFKIFAKEEKIVLLTKFNIKIVEKWLYEHNLDKYVNYVTNSKMLWNIYDKFKFKLMFINTLEDEEEFLNNFH